MKSTDNFDAPAVRSTHVTISETSDVTALAAHCVEQIDDAIKGLETCEAARVCMQIASLMAERVAYERAQCWSPDRTADLITLAANLDRLSRTAF